jgi:hypothetical protein
MIKIGDLHEMLAKELGGAEKIIQIVPMACEDCELWAAGAPCFRKRGKELDDCEDFIPFDRSGCVYIGGKWFTKE